MPTYGAMPTCGVATCVGTCARAWLLSHTPFFSTLPFSEKRCHAASCPVGVSCLSWMRSSAVRAWVRARVQTLMNQADGIEKRFASNSPRSHAGSHPALPFGERGTPRWPSRNRREARPTNLAGREGARSLGTGLRRAQYAQVHGPSCGYAATTFLSLVRFRV